MKLSKHKGITLIEILLVISAIGVLATIVIIAINPLRQLAQARDTNRRAAAESLKSALFQYNIDNEAYPPGLTTSLQDVCRPGGSTDCVDLESYLVPLYIADIPVDEVSVGDSSGYQVGLDASTNKLQVVAKHYEVEQIGEYVVVTDQLFASFDAGNSASYPGTGTTWTDTTSSGFIATLSSGVVFNTNNGGKFTFDEGDDDNAVIPYAPSMDLGQHWTLEAAVYINTTDADPRMDPIIWKIADPGTHEDQYYIGWNGPGFRAGFERASDDNDFLVAVTGLTNQTWYHVVATYDDDFLRMYINGVLITENQIGSQIAYKGSEDLYIGHLEHSNHNPKGNFDGDIAIARIYNKALSDTEVNQNFEAIRNRFGL